MKISYLAIIAFNINREASHIIALFGLSDLAGMVHLNDHHLFPRLQFDTASDILGLASGQAGSTLIFKVTLSR